MKRILVVALSFFVALPAFAALPVGHAAPYFTAQASLGGKVYTYSLKQALHKGPVVLYFYPAAFSKGCTIEAHDFAAAMPRYRALGATVIGVSHDSIATLNRFSTSVCRSKFPVAADTHQRIMRAYHSVLASNPTRAERVSYVITPNGRIFYRYVNRNPAHHVANTLAALARWRAPNDHH